MEEVVVESPLPEAFAASVVGVVRAEATTTTPLPRLPLGLFYCFHSSIHDPYLKRYCLTHCTDSSSNEVRPMGGRAIVVESGFVVLESPLQSYRRRRNGIISTDATGEGRMVDLLM